MGICARLILQWFVLPRCNLFLAGKFSVDYSSCNVIELVILFELQVIKFLNGSLPAIIVKLFFHCGCCRTHKSSTLNPSESTNQ